MRYTLVGDHAQDLADGRILAPGESVHLSAAAERDNQRLIDEGVLLKAERTKKEGSA